MAGKIAHKILFSFAKFLAPKIGETEGGKNFDNNIKYEPRLITGLITNQSRLVELGYGDSNIGKTGCVALFNILLLKGRPRPISYIVKDLQEAQVLINRGKWGTNPFELEGIMRKYGLNPMEIDSVMEAESRMEPGDILFPTVWNSNNLFRGIHGYVIRKTDDSKYLTYNKNYRNSPEEFLDLKTAIEPGRFIVGYIIR